MLFLSLKIVLYALLFTFSGISVSAQSPHVQLGLGAWPGAGIQLVYVQAQSVYSLEILVSIDTELWKERTPIYLSSGVGTAIRPLGILRVIGQANYPYDLDVGIRFGPALTFLKSPTREEKNRQFSLFLDPYIRYTHQIGKPIAFLEIGAQRPSIRAGFGF